MSLSPLWSALLLPPSNLLLAGAAGSVVAGRHRLVRVGVTACLALLLVLSLPVTAGTILGSLWDARLARPTETPPGAIVILSGDYRVVVEPAPTSEPGPLTLERERAGAALARRTGLPVLVTGGVPGAGGPSLAALMTASLRDDFGVGTRWEEKRSDDTWENAERSAEMLRAAGISAVYLVTHSWHMRRAVIAFRHFGLETVAAPVRLDRPPHGEADEFVPSPQALLNSFYGLHEWVGVAYYALRG